MAEFQEPPYPQGIFIPEVRSVFYPFSLGDDLALALTWILSLPSRKPDHSQEHLALT